MLKAASWGYDETSVMWDDLPTINRSLSIPINQDNKLVTCKGMIKNSEKDQFIEELDDTYRNQVILGERVRSCRPSKGKLLLGMLLS